MSGVDDKKPGRGDIETVALDPRTITGPNWPVVLATLEQLAPNTGIRALRLGYVALLQHLTREMALDSAPASLVNEAEAIVQILRHMPWDLG